MEKIKDLMSHALDYRDTLSERGTTSWVYYLGGDETPFCLSFVFPTLRRTIMISSVLAVALLCALVVPLPAQEADSLSFAGSVYAALPQPARFEAAATDELSVWKSRIKAVAANIPAYPADHYRSGGRGIVITTGRRTYFTAAVVTVRVIREHLKSSLPIELVYGGAAELPPAAVAYLSTTWPDIHMVDLTAVPELQGVSLQGYHIKVLAIYYSRFKEVLWLDSDDMPLADPASLFESKLYQQYGAVFWPGMVHACPCSNAEASFA